MEKGFDFKKKTGVKWIDEMRAILQEEDALRKKYPEYSGE